MGIGLVGRYARSETPKRMPRIIISKESTHGVELILDVTRKAPSSGSKLGSSFQDHVQGFRWEEMRDPRQLRVVYAVVLPPDDT